MQAGDGACVASARRGRRRSARPGHAQSRKSPLLRDSAMRRGRHKMAAHGVKRLLSRSPHQTVAPTAPSPGTFPHTSRRLFTSSTPSLTLIPHLLLRPYNLQDIKNDSNPQVQPRQLRTLHSVRRRRYRGIPVPPPKNKQKKLMLGSHLRSPREVPSKALQPPAKSRPTAQRSNAPHSAHLPPRRRPWLPFRPSSSTHHHSPKLRMRPHT